MKLFEWLNSPIIIQGRPLMWRPIVWMIVMPILGFVIGYYSR